MYGEEQCQGVYKSGPKKGKQCENKAYFNLDDNLLCGVHGKGGVELKKNPRKKQMKAQKDVEQKDECERYADKNLDEGFMGDVAVAKLMMRKEAPGITGYLRIFPNFKHGGRKDGIGMPSLSPMSLGPVNHVMKRFPPADNLENYYQGAKVYPGETNKEGEITEESISSRNKIYVDRLPYRHKYDSPYYIGQKGVDVPLFSAYYTNKDEEKRLNYLESRYMYCHYYEKLVESEEDFLTLKDLIEGGFNLLIIGYDGRPVEMKEGEELKDTLWRYYNDTTKPFGHELVLYTLLTINKDDYPWNRYRREHGELYKDLV